MPKVFISYRRDDSAYVAHMIYAELSRHFGPGSVVLDVDAIPLGVDFVAYLHDQVAQCDALLALVNPVQRKLFGGTRNILKSLLAEQLFSMLLAPAMMTLTMMRIVSTQPAAAMPKLIQHHILALRELSRAPSMSPVMSLLSTWLAKTIAGIAVGQKQRMRTAMDQPR